MADRPAIVRFQVNPQKVLEALVYVAQRSPGLPVWRIMKVLYFAEKRHLGLHGRPITGDDYIAMSDGPVPSLAYDLLKREAFLPDELLDQAAAALEVVTRTETHPSSVSALRSPDLEVLSVSDRKCLDWGIENVARLPYDKLWQMSHREPAYRAAAPNSAMPVELMIEPDVPHRDQLLEQLRETAGEMVL